MTQPSKKSSPAKPGAAKNAGANRGTLLLIGGLALMVVIAVVVGVIVAGGDDTTSTNGTVAEYQPVTVSGTLPAFNDTPDDAGGAAAPTISGKTFGGTDLSVPEAGRPTMIAFVAHWCPHCQKEVPLISKWAPANLNGVDLVAVATGTDPKQNNYPPSAWLYREGWPGKVIVDDKKATAATAYGLSGYPYLIFVGADGKVKARLSGEQPEAELNKAIAKIAPSATDTSTPAG